MESFLAQWMPINGSQHGPALDQMNALVHWLMLFLFIGWTAYFIYVLFRFRAGANPRASYKGATSHFSQYVEVGIAVIEAVLLVFFAIPAWASWVTPDDEATDRVEVRVIAQQFAWNVHYPGPDGVFGATDIEMITNTNAIGLDRSDPYAVDDVVKLNEMHLPVDRDITIYLSSKDVIHSFFLPQMRVKQDAVPGLQVPIHFRPVMETPQESLYPACAANSDCWEIACAQLCGLTHYRMKGFYNVHSQAGYDAWLANEVALVMPAAPAAAVDPAAAPADGAAVQGGEAAEQHDGEGH